MICVTRGPWSCPSAPSLQHPMSSLSLGAGMEPLPPSVPACSHSASEPGCSALLPLLLTLLFLALTLSFSSSPLLFLAPGRSSATSPSSLCLSWRSHGSRAHSHDHLECLCSPGLRLHPSPGAGGSGRGTEKLFQPPPGAGTGVPRARSSKPYSPPNNECNNRGSCCLPPPDGPRGRWWLPVATGWTLSDGVSLPKMPECRGWRPNGVLEAAGSRQSVYSQARGTTPPTPPAPPSRVRVPEDSPHGNLFLVSLSLQPPLPASSQHGSGFRRRGFSPTAL